MRLVSFVLALCVGFYAPIAEAHKGRHHWHKRHHHHIHVSGFRSFMSNLEGGSQTIRAMVTEIAQRNGVSPMIAHAIVRIESNYRCNAANHGALGIMQTKVQTARSVGVHGSLFDCRNGIEAGTRYLRQAIQMHGNGCAAYSAFQSGLGVHRCSSYGRRVMALAHLGSS